MAKPLIEPDLQEQASVVSSREAGRVAPPASVRAYEPIEAIENEPESADTMELPAAPLSVERPKIRPRSRIVTVHPFGLNQSDLQRGLMFVVAAGITLYFLSLVAPILPPFILAFFLAALLDPTLRYYERRGTSRVRTIFMLYLLALFTIIGLALLVAPRVTSQLEDISKNFGAYTTNIQNTADTFLQQNAKTLQRFGVKQKHLSELLNQNSGPVRSALGAFLGGLTEFLTGLASKILWLVLIPVTAFFLMRDFPLLRARLVALFPETYQENVDTISREITDLFSAYLRGLAKICTLFAITACVVFWALGIADWMLLGLLAGMFYAVPYVGQLGTSIVVGAVCYSMPAHKTLLLLPVSTNSPGYTVSVICCIIGMGIVFDQIIYPRVVGASVGLHPVISIFAITAGAMLFGVPGILLAVPVAASLQVVMMCCFPRLSARPPSHLLEPALPLAREP